MAAEYQTDSHSIKHRQALVQELKGHSLFRDKLQLLLAVARINTGPSRSGTSNLWNSNILVDWLKRGERKKSLLPTVILLFVLSGLNIACVVLTGLGVIPAIWPITFLLYVGAMIIRQSRIATAWGELHELEKALTHFQVVFRYLESRCYNNTPGVAEICSSFVEKVSDLQGR